MNLRLLNKTQRQLRDIFASVSYNLTMKRIAPPVQKTQPLIDSLLTAYWGNQYHRCNNLANACEHLSSKASNECDLDIRT